MSSPVRFRNFLFRLRSYRGYSQKQLAMLVGLRKSRAVSDFEAGRRLPPLAVALSLEVALGTRLSEIYPDLMEDICRQAVTREDHLPARFSRHIKGRVLGKE